MKQQEKHNEAESPETVTASGLRLLPWTAGAMLLLATAVFAGFYWSSHVTVQQVRFEGHHFLSKEDLQKVDIPVGISPDSMNFIQIIDRIEQIPYVRRARISVEPGGNLLVSIAERQPVALLADGERKIYIDREGLRLPIVHENPVDVPILYGFDADPMHDTLKGEPFAAVSDFLSNLRRRPVSDATISEIAWTRGEGIVALTGRSGVKLMFGRYDYADRLRNWEAFYGEVIREKGMDRMRSVDLRFRGQIVTREGWKPYE